MFRFLISALLFVFLLAPARAESADQQAFQAVISGQLDAFKTEDYQTAYSYAAPIVKGVFPNVDTFMAMVKRGYGPIYKNSKYVFTELKTDTLGRPAQHVIITASDGKRYEAVYAMQQQPDGSWKIAGVQMVEIPSVDA
jgi:ketosteroid isomerase-like protein